MSAVRAFLAGIVDYAGLFPPAALDMPTAVRNYAQYRIDDAAWMLGRFVVPVARLDEFRDVLSAETRPDESPWRLTALFGSDVLGDIDRVRAFNIESDRARVDSVEARARDAETIAMLASAGLADVFAELTLGADLEAMIDACAQARIGAKIRTGGVTVDAFVSSSDIVRFMRACIEARVRFKATAGLHHPLAGEYPVSYDPNAPEATMHGYLSLFLAAALLRAGGSDEEAVMLLEERDADAFAISPTGIEWHGHLFSAGDLRASRDRAAVSFGSCSFREPVDELHGLSLAP